MDEIVALVAGAALGGIATYVAVYNQHALAGLLVFAAGSVVVFVLLGQAPPSTGSPSNLVIGFLERGGWLALIGAGAGAIAAGYFATEQRKREGK